MKNNQITCDSCNRDLTETSNCVGYRLALNVENITPTPGPVTMMGVQRPLKNDRHFCWVRCLTKWLESGGENR